MVIKHGTCTYIFQGQYEYRAQGQKWQASMKNLKVSLTIYKYYEK